MKILHFADVHARTEDLDEIQRCAQYLLDKAREEKPDLIIDAGDIFDSQHVRADSPAVKYIHRWVKELADIAPVARIMGTRSHDGRASEILDLIGAANQIRTAVSPMQVYLTANGNLWTSEELEAASSGLATPVPVQAVVSLVPAPTKEHLAGLVDGDIKETDAMIAQGLTALFMGLGAQAADFPGTAHILVGHWNTTGAYISPTQILTGVDIEVSRDMMMMANPSLVALGHIHKSQHLGSDPIFYAGSTQINTWGELDPKGFWIHEIESSELQSRFIETPTRRRLLVSHDFTRHDLNPVSAITRAAAEICAPHTIDATAKEAMVRVAIKYFQDEEAKFSDDEIARIFPNAHSVEILRTRIARANVRAARMLEIERLRDKIEQRAELIGEPIPTGVLEAADMLEDMAPETLLAEIEAEIDESPVNVRRAA
jgi:DNA repair exonuclease SbcCD nuclease subunit